jgi:hypothetical protein
MRSKCDGSQRSYNRGCRCAACKSAAADARRERRKRQSEAVGEPETVDTGGQLVSVPTFEPSTSVTGSGPVESAVSLEIEQLGPHRRPGVAAVALALARILDNPKAVSSQPPAAGQLVHAMNTLRKSATGAMPKLASIRSMTSKNPPSGA